MVMNDKDRCTDLRTGIGDGWAFGGDGIWIHRGDARRITAPHEFGHVLQFYSGGLETSWSDGYNPTPTGYQPITLTTRQLSGHSERLTTI